MRRTLHIIAVVLIAVLAIGLYKAKTDAAQARAHVAQLEHEIADAQADMRALRADIAHLESPARVEQLAQSQLHLRPGGESAALPESAIDSHLPAPQAPHANPSPSRTH
jgi:cell division protein FtsL